MPSQFSVTGTTLKRFTQASTLLWELDPVRGEPTIYSLDRHPSDAHQEAADRQVDKFLDSVALICATRKDPDTISGAALEEGAPEGTIVRLSSNGGLPEETLRQVRGIFEVLNNVAEAGSKSPDSESQILRKIVELDIDKISHYLEQIQRHSRMFQRDVEWALDNPNCLKGIVEPHESHRFLDWILRLCLLAQKQFSPDRNNILAYIQLASKAKWVYGRCIEAMFKAQGVAVSQWVTNVYKLGRYEVATKVLLRFAVENRSLFCPMIVEPLPAPSKETYNLSPKERHLEATLRRSIGGDIGEPLMRLGRYWDVSDPEKHFRRTYPRERAVHAELQLVNFYDHNRDKLPRRRFIGVSKKSCFLCHKFLQHHPSNFAASACHQKVYLNWLTPPCRDSKIYKQYRKLISELSVAMETVAKHEIEQKLVVGARRLVPADSTAGVSLPVSFAPQAIHQSDHNISQPASDSADVTLEQETWHNSGESGTQEEHSLGIGGSATVEVTPPAITFHVKRADDPRRQDLVTLADLIDPLTERPSWELLCLILVSDKRFGVGFDEVHEYLLVNQSLRVGSDRQFAACLQYLRNAQSWNNEASVNVYKDLAIS